MRYSQITPEIYVGSQYSQAGKRKLKQFGINGSVNLRIEFDDAVHGLDLEEYCYLPKFRPKKGQVGVERVRQQRQNSVFEQKGQPD